MKYSKKISLLLVLLLALYSGSYFFIEIYKSQRVDEILKEHSRYLDISYKQGLDRFKIIGEHIYYSMQNDVEFVELLFKANDKNLKESHKRIYEHLEDEFYRLKSSGIMGVHIILPNGKTIVRMYKEEKYGDVITLLRPTLHAVNNEQRYIAGFEEGKTSHGYREVHPLYKNGEYIGAVEIMFSSTKLQDYTMKASKIHTHFIVNKNVFEHNAWKSNVAEPYEDSIEHKQYLFSLNDHVHHNRLQESAQRIIKPLQKDINRGIDSAQEFVLYLVVDGKAEILVFKPVQRFIDQKVIAYLVSYSDSENLYTLDKSTFNLKLILALIFIFTYLVILKFLKEKETILNELKYDELTQIYNRKYFMSSSRKECKKLNEQGELFSIVMADIDFFKNVNDTHGHQYGDTVLREFATILKESIRGVDTVARYGGEEFIILLLTDKDNAYRAVEGIRKKVSAYNFGENKIKLTASFGLAQCNGNGEFLELISRADKALYSAKENGRNQVQVG